MALFDQIGKRVTDASRGVTQQTKNLADTAKYNNAISAEEKAILEAYTEIGKAYYKAHKDDPNAENIKILNAITEAFEKIHQYKERIKEIKGIIKCPNCGADVPHTSLFCNTCGARIPREAAAPAPAGETRTCPSCGAEIFADVKFCTACGARILKAAAPVPVGETKTCPSCGAEVSADDKFCTACGTAMK